MSKVNRNEKGQFEPGSSGNPSGRPKGSLTKLMREFMYEIDDSGFSRMQQLCIILWDSALKGDLQAIKMIMDRVDGTPRQTIETNVHQFDTIKLMEIGEEPEPSDKIVA